MHDLHSASILIVETDEKHAASLFRKVQNLLFMDIVLCTNQDQIISYFAEFVPDLVISENFLDKKSNIRKLLMEYHDSSEVPFIITTDNYDSLILDQIIKLAPFDLLPKSVSEFELGKSIKLGLLYTKSNTRSDVLPDFVFVRAGKELRKLALSDIQYLSVDGKYVEIFSKVKKYIIRSSLSDFARQLPSNFVKIHQSFVINTDYLSAINVEDNIVKIDAYQLPLSRNYRRELLNSFPSI
jgi:DNA-binding LytR/AlgR family response regulator